MENHVFNCSRFLVQYHCQLFFRLIGQQEAPFRRGLFPVIVRVAPRTAAPAWLPLDICGLSRLLLRRLVRLSFLLPVLGRFRRVLCPFRRRGGICIPSGFRRVPGGFLGRLGGSFRRRVKFHLPFQRFSCFFRLFQRLCIVYGQHAHFFQRVRRPRLIVRGQPGQFIGR